MDINNGIQLFIIDEISLSLYELIRREVVSRGYNVDVAAYNNETDFTAAKNSLRTSLAAQGKQIIDVFSPGSVQARDAKSVCSIFIDRKEDNYGGTGGYPATFYEIESGTDENTKYSKKYYPDSTSNITYEIRIVSDDTFHENVMSDVVRKAIKARHYHKAWDLNSIDFFEDKLFLITYQGSVNLSNRDYNERVFKYVVHDVFIEDAPLIKSNIPVLKTVEWTLYVVNFEEDMETVGNITDTLPESNSGEQPWEWWSINVDPAATIVADEKLTGEVAPILYINEMPIKWASKGIVQVPGGMDFTAIGGASGDLTFQYRNIPTP